MGIRYNIQVLVILTVLYDKDLAAMIVICWLELLLTPVYGNIFKSEVTAT